MTQLQRTHRIAVDEDALDGNAIRAVLARYFRDRPKNHTQALGKRPVVAAYRAAGDVVGAFILEIHDAETGDARARIDAEYALSLSQN
jgi:hypothetical protein